MNTNYRVIHHQVKKIICVLDEVLKKRLAARSAKTERPAQQREPKLCCAGQYTQAGASTQTKRGSSDMRTNEVDDLKRTTRILDVLARYGIQAEQKGRQYMAKCPFHDDSTPSLSVDPIKNVWHCFGCGAGGSVLDFVMKKDGLTFREAADKLLVDGGQVKRGSQIAAPSKSRTADAALIESIVEHYHKTLCGTDTRGLDYLKGRSLADPETLKTFRVGFVNGSLKSVLPASAVEPLQQIGILNEKGNEFFYGCIVVPIFSRRSLGEARPRRCTGRQPSRGQPDISTCRDNIAAS